MARLANDALPTDEDLIGVMSRWGCLSLRALCSELWPDLRWLPLYAGEDSVSGKALDGRGVTRALWVWMRLGHLVEGGCVRIAGRDPHEVDGIGAIAFEVLGPRRAAA